MTLSPVIGTLEDVRTLYCDANIYIDIARGGIPPNELEALRVAVMTGRIDGLVSVSTIEELLGRWEGDRAGTIKQLAIVRDLFGFSNLLKP